MNELTDRQQAILGFVRERIEADGLPPTWAEIARAFGFRQTRCSLSSASRATTWPMAYARTSPQYRPSMAKSWPACTSIGA